MFKLFINVYIQHFFNTLDWTQNTVLTKIIKMEKSVQFKSS